MSAFRLRWKTVAVIAGVILIAFLVWRYQANIAARIRAVTGYEQMAQTLEEQRAAFNKLEAEVERRRRIDKKWRKELQQIRVKLGSVEGEIYELEKRYEKVSDWADNAWPAPLVKRVRSIYQDSDKNGSEAYPSTEEVDRTNRNAGNATSEERD